MASRRTRSLFALLVVTSALCLTAAVVSAAQLTLSWTDNSGGTATFSVERKTGTTGSYAQIRHRVHPRRM
jgi:hypothetical protein